MLNKCVLFCIVLASFVPRMAMASSSPPGYVSYPWSADTGVFMFDLSTDKTALPACSGINAVPHRWAINSTTSAGQAMIAVVMAAYVNGKRIAISGTHGCDLWSDTETVWYLQIIE